MVQTLEKIAKRKEQVSPTVKEAMTSMLGVNVDQINEDISNKLVEGNFDFEVNLKLGFKKAKEEFKKEYLIRLLQHTNGNISEAGKISGLDRRSIHRLIKRYNLDIGDARQQPFKFNEDKKIEYVREIISETLDRYDLTRGRYQVNEDVTKKISEKLPIFSLSFDEAVDLFEKEFVKKALSEFGSQKKASREIGLRYETLHKKAKEFGLV